MSISACLLLPTLALCGGVIETQSNCSVEARNSLVQEILAGMEVVTVTAQRPIFSFDGVITIGGPSTFTQDSAYFEYAAAMRNSARLFAHWVNSLKGGVVVNDKRYAMRFIFVDDGGSAAQVGDATLHAIEDFGLDFVVGGFSTGLTLEAVPVAADHDLVFVSAGAGTPMPFEMSNLSFGMASPQERKVSMLLDSIRAAAAAVDDSDHDFHADGSVCGARGHRRVRARDPDHQRRPARGG